MFKVSGCILFAIFFIACSHKIEPALPGEGEETLKKIIAQKDSSADWTSEVNPPEAARAKSAVALAPDNIFASREHSEYEMVFPELEGFGSLDTSVIDQNQREFIAAFCGAVIVGDKTQASARMNQHNAFLLTIFFNDMRDVEFTDRYILGQAGMRGNLWQIPVRFFVKARSGTLNAASGISAENGHVDARLFLSMGESIVIDQITYGEIIYD
jgi:hypothetical protein